LHLWQATRTRGRLFERRWGAAVPVYSGLSSILALLFKND
jgi:hypothetical protein